MNTKVLGGGSSGAKFDGKRPIKGSPSIGDNFNTENVVDFLESAFFPFVAALISINSGTSYFEKGTSQTIAISGSITANDEDTFSNARIEKSIGNDIPFAAQAGAYSLSDAAINADIDYRSKVDVGGNGTPTTIESQQKRIRFIFPFFHGMVSEALNGDTMYAGLTKLLQTKSNKSILLNGSNKYIYFAYPASYGALSNIKDQNNFDVTGSFQSEDMLITGLQGGLSETYKVYRTINKTDVNSANFTFNF